jgi:tetraacyldisaccharide 4'-kinase
MMPKFWENKNIFSLLLFPLSIIYGVIFEIKFYLQQPRKFDKKIICIGNVTVGGGGKTPTAIAIAKILIENGYKVAFAIKNYKSKSKLNFIITDKSKYSDEIIEEAFLLSKIAPTFVAAKRIDAIKQASKTKCDYIIVDDGYQNNEFYKDISILVIDGIQKIGNGFLLPAGPLRQCFDSAVKAADFIVMINSHDEKLVKKITAHGKKIISAKAVISVNDKLAQHDKFFAFAGIGYPFKFIKTLELNKYEIVGNKFYPDHYKYSEKDIIFLEKLADNYSAKLITTMKDAVKIPILKNLVVCHYEIKFDNGFKEVLAK